MSSKHVRTLPIFMVIVFLLCFFAPCGPGLAADTWTQVASGGIEGHFNAESQSGVLCQAQLGSDLYVGTSATSANGAQVWRYDGASWTKVATGGFGDTTNIHIYSMKVLGSYLYAGTNNPTSGCEVWRTSDGTTWEQVNADGFGDSNNGRVHCMEVFGSYLYAGTFNQSTGAELWRTDGTGATLIWTQVNADGFGGTNPERNWTVQCMTSSGSYLYAGVSNEWTGCRAYRTALSGGPPFIDWTQVNASAFGEGAPINNKYIPSMIFYNSYLYVGTSTEGVVGGHGGQLWRSALSGGPPFTDWTKVNSNGFGDSDDYEVRALIGYGGYLYAGTRNNVDGGRLFRTAESGGPPYTDWVKVNSNGFGDADNRILYSMSVYNSNLYVGTYNVDSEVGGQLWRTGASGGPPFTDWTQVNLSGFSGNSNAAAMCSAVLGSDLYVGTSGGRGCQVWKYNGTTWTQVNTDGFGTSANNSADSMVVFGSYLYVATNNGGGSQVWRTAGGVSPTWAQVNSSGFGGSYNTAQLEV